MHYHLLVLTLRGGQNGGLEQGWMSLMYWIEWRLASFAVSGAEVAILNLAALNLSCGVFVTEMEPDSTRWTSLNPQTWPHWRACFLGVMLHEKIGRCFNVSVALRCEQMTERLLSTEIETSDVLLSNLQKKISWGLAFKQATDSGDGPESCFAFTPTVKSQRINPIPYSTTSSLVKSKKRTVFKTLRALQAANSPLRKVIYCTCSQVAAVCLNLLTQLARFKAA